MDPSQALGWFKLPQRVLWALLLITGLVLWGPPWFVTGLGLETFIDTYRMWLGVVFLLFLAATLPTPIHSAATKAWEWFEDRRGKKARRTRLHNLSNDEKEVLRYYVTKNVRTQTLDMADGVAPALEKDWIIYRASNVSRGYTDFAYNIQQWALDYIREHPEVLDAV
ncbi:superinfection exclusion B family protein [Xanthomonas hortorum]|uniref:superinfection exclusion B family protein n=1 Tax=Xanthomonas hortorum TaxID=56454 RepID=UPI00293594F9|nr:super-infection exclusion protein B [Xanthomonas hortorum]MDV2452772.1 super-infection exclusion protein B [Xanthomonas hortorum NBC5720]